MTAKEMFEELGYKFEKDKSNKIETFYKYTDNADYYIEFNLMDKTYTCYYCFPVTMPELRAIEQKCRELGWIL